MVCLVRHAAPAAKGLLRQKRQAVAERRGCDSDRNDEDEEPQYLQRTPSRFGRGVITNATTTGKSLLFSAQAVGNNDSGTQHIDSVFAAAVVVLVTVRKLVRGRVSRIEKARGRDALLAVFLALFCFVLSGCADPKPGTTASGGEPGLPSAEVDIRGIVTEVGRMPQETNGGGGAEERVGVVLVEEDPDEETGSQKDSVTVTKATKLFERRGRDPTRIRFDDLKVGQRARAWYAGPVAESYPRQAMASLIAVHLSAE